MATELRNYCRLLHKIRCDCRLSLEEEMLLLEEHGMATRQLRNRAAMLRLLSNSRPGEAVKIKVEQPPARFSRCFDEIEDRTCLEDKMEGLKAMLGGIELADYKPPEQGYGSKTVAFLNDILGSLNLSGMPSITNATQLANAAIGRGKATPGFILCLELLTSKLDLRTGAAVRRRELCPRYNASSCLVCVSTSLSRQPKGRGAELPMVCCSGAWSMMACG